MSDMVQCVATALLASKGFDAYGRVVSTEELARAAIVAVREYIRAGHDECLYDGYGCRTKIARLIDEAVE